MQLLGTETVSQCAGEASKGVRRTQVALVLQRKDGILHIILQSNSECPSIEAQLPMLLKPNSPFHPAQGLC